jgi:VanZ family protein
LIAVFTLCPPEVRPSVTENAQIERALAYLLTGALFVLGYPRSRAAVALGLLFAVVGLEAGQMFVPGRDARVSDAIAKAFGVLTGAALGSVGPWSKIGRENTINGAERSTEGAK